MDSSAGVSFISTVIGGIISAGTAWLVMSRKVEQENARQIREFKWKQNQILRKRQEQLFFLIEEIQFAFTTTQQDIFDTADISENEYNQYYTETVNKIHKAQMLANLYFEPVVREMNEIESISNNIWGRQQNYLGHAKKEKQDRGALGREIMEYRKDLNSHCAEALYILQSQKVVRSLQ